MKTVKVSIQDENTLVLQEDANKGDLIDLKSLHDLDIDKTTITAVVNTIRRREFDEKLKEEADRIKREKDLEWKNKENDINFKKDSEISDLKARLDKSETEKKLAVSEATRPLEVQLVKKESEKESELSRLNDKYQNELKTKDEMIAYYKDMKAKLPTKMVGETLEQHCEIVFNKIRATAFPRATFEKDNDASGGSKGDYIYREMDEKGNEIISIMFDMKNEGDETVTKQKNEDFLKELDKDRTEKKCEYAILVSLLEIENELYDGITDVSYHYEKMYVIRPQFFIPIISILRNEALKSLRYKAELALVRSQNIDVTNFESQLIDFQSSFGRSFGLAHDRFSDAIEGIDKSIAQLQKIKDNLQKADDHYRIANSKAEDLSIKKLTRGNPTMTAKFDDLKKK